MFWMGDTASCSHWLHTCEHKATHHPPTVTDACSPCTIYPLFQQIHQFYRHVVIVANIWRTFFQFLEVF